MKKTFTRKPGSRFLYTWSPDDFISKNLNDGGRVKKYFCNAEPRTQGEDWVTRYCYEKINENGVIKRIAYVECDYVK